MTWTTGPGSTAWLDIEQAFAREVAAPDWTPHGYDGSPRACRPWYPPHWCPVHADALTAGHRRAFAESFRRVRQSVWGYRQAVLEASLRPQGDDWAGYG